MKLSPRNIFIAAALIAGVTCEAVEMDALTSILLKQQQQGKRKVKRQENGAREYTPIMMMISDDSVIEELEANEVVIFNRRDNLLLTCVPNDKLNDVLSTIPGILHVSATTGQEPSLDIARSTGNVDAIHFGQMELARCYDGEGVVVGFSDTGFDPNHIAFQGRVAEVHHFDGYTASHLSATTPDEIAAWTTDNQDKYHATHVGGILTGAYMGNDYCGIATGSELVATTSGLDDPSLLAGVEKVIEYAKSQGKRAVVNLSVSSYLGPHDGTDLIGQYLSKCAEDAVICISSGNEGRNNNFASITFTPEMTSNGVLVNTKRTYDGNNVDGYVDLWGADERPFGVQIGIIDWETQQLVATLPVMSNNTDYNFYYVDGDSYPVFGQYFTGYIMVEAQLSQFNNRHNIVLAYDINPTAKMSNSTRGRYFLAVIPTGESGVHVDMYVDGMISYFGTYPGSLRTNADGSISNLGCADGVITVGAWNTRNTAPLYPEGERTWTTVNNTVTPYNSYSNISTIKPLPHFCAPGMYVVSTISGPYLAAHPSSELSALESIDGKEYGWIGISGSSMASPYAAGVMALWLEANPTLTNEELLQVAQKTANKNFGDISDPRWGAGALDAMAGLKEILKNSSVDTSIMPESWPNPVISVSADRHLEVVTAGDRPADVTVYTASGMSVDPTTSLQPGIYVVSVKGYRPVKIAVR